MWIRSGCGNRYCCWCDWSLLCRCPCNWVVVLLPPTCRRRLCQCWLVVIKAFRGSGDVDVEPGVIQVFVLRSQCDLAMAALSFVISDRFFGFFAGVREWLSHINTIVLANLHTGTHTTKSVSMKTQPLCTYLFDDHINCASFLISPSPFHCGHWSLDFTFRFQ